MILAPGKQISVQGPYLPRESTRGSGHIRCRCRPEGRGALAQAIATHKLPAVSSTLLPGALQDSRAEDNSMGVRYPNSGQSMNLRDGQ